MEWWNADDIHGDIGANILVMYARRSFVFIIILFIIIGIIKGWK